MPTAPTTDAIFETDSALVDLKGIIAALEFARQHRAGNAAQTADLVVDVLLPMAARQVEKVQEALYAIPTKQPVASAEESQ